MNTVVCRPATVSDVHYLAPRMLPADAAEVRAASGNEPLVSLLTALETPGDNYVCSPVARPNEPFCIFGVFPTPFSEVGAIWLLCAEGLHQNRAGFLRESRVWFDKFSRRYPILWNVVDERNTAHVRFLRWHGCTFINRHPTFGHERRPFLEFVRLSCVTP